MKHFKITYLIFAVLALSSILLQSCKPDDDDPKVDNASLTIKVNHYVDSSIVTPNQLIYTNKAGYSYSVSRLEYFLSDFTLINFGNAGHAISHTQYINFEDSKTNTFTISGLPIGEYKLISFHFGLSEARNVSYSLPNTPENIGMAWPESMGGGYHFMKLEGRYLFDSKKLGYTFHLGTNICTMEVTLPINLSITKETNSITLDMNINEWMQNPHTYDFEQNGNYTMGDTSTMTMVRDNGHNVFRLHDK
jgi:hypothetical protein